MSDRSLRLLRLASLALAGLAILIVPATAHAWGPLAHLSFSAQALEALPATASPLRGLLAGLANEFLYGSLAADIVVGKNLARWAHHAHNWKNGFRVLRAARSDAERAFSWGFLAHLAADTVAHNYYVPWKSVSSFHAPRTGHGYWELRYEQRMDPALSEVARTVTHRTYRGHDALLRTELREGCVLPFGLSRRLFGSVLASARMPRFQRLSRIALAPHRFLPLEEELVEETRALAVGSIVELLVEGEDARCIRSDATGKKPLATARKLRHDLQRHARRDRAAAHAFAADVRENFRLAIDRSLVLPSSVHRLAG
jgi:hypothetical protein